MIRLNNLDKKTLKLKRELDEELTGLQNLAEVQKVKNQDRRGYKSYEGDKCHYIEDYQKGFNFCIDKKNVAINLDNFKINRIKKLDYQN